MDEGLPILIIEDSENDIMLLKLALKRAGSKRPMQIAHDGQEAIDYLSGSGPFADRAKFPFPGIIVSDLKMPRMGGFEVLEWLRHHPECAVIPFIVLSASKQEPDIKRAYELGASSYMVKPASLDELQCMVRLTCDYWAICEKPEYSDNC